MKIGILTITDGQNYGNRLQNYALQEVLRDFGCDVYTVRRKTKRDLNIFNELLFRTKNLVKLIIGRKDTFFYRIKRKKAFVDFNKKYIKFTHQILYNNKAPKDFYKKFDYFVCGSDQIWNANFEVVSEDILNHLASFAKPSQRVAYAASFGTDSFAVGFEQLFVDELQKFKAIGLREQTGVDLLEEKLNRSDIKLVLDPTMLISRDKWKQFANEPQYPHSDSFIVTYFLSGKSKRITEYVENIALHSDADVINLDIEFLSDNCIVNSRHFSTSPTEFVWLIEHAKCILTDSFHATVFAILFNRPFAVFQRIATEKNNNMNSRIDGLLEMFSLEKFAGDIMEPDIIPVTYDNDIIEIILNKERKKSLDFLHEVVQ